MIIWQSNDAHNPNLVARCEYNFPNYTVCVINIKTNELKHESFHHTFEPRFGIDAEDNKTSVEIAIKLADSFK